MSSVSIQASSPQRQFLQAILSNEATDVVCFGGARGGGKTWVSCLAMVLRRIKYTGTRGLMIRKTQSASDQNLKAEIDKVIAQLGIPLGAIKYKVNDKLFVFPNGSTIKLGYCKLNSDYEQYMGTEYADICFEEATQHTRGNWQLVGGSNRSNNPDCRPKRWLTANPGGIGHRWVLEDFIDDRSRKSGVLYIPSLLKNNFAQLENDPGYARRILNVLPDWQRRQWRDGDWHAIAGQYFSLPPEMFRETFVAGINEHEGTVQIPYWAKFYGGVDYGSTKPFAVVWFARWKDFNGRNRVHVVKELYRAGLHLDEQAHRVLEIQNDLQTLQIMNGGTTYYGDPAVAKRVEGEAAEAGRTIRNTWAKHKFYVQPAHTNARVPGWELLKYLINQRILTIDPSCMALISEMEGVITEGTRGGGEPIGEDIEQGSDINDHALDALRYGVVSTFRVGFREKQPDPYNLNNYRETA